MKVETLITSLVYLEYNEKYGVSPYNLLGIYLKENKVLIRIKSKEAGMNEHIAKPIDMKLLVNIIAQLVH